MMMKKLFPVKFQHQEPPTFDENVCLANKSELFTRLYAYEVPHTLS